MHVTLVAAELFAFSLVGHVLVWRIRLPQRPLLVLLGWFLVAAPLVFLPLHIMLGGKASLPQSVAECLQVALFQVAAGLAYIVTYSALEARSPSLTIIRRVAEAGTAGRLRSDVQRMIATQDSLRTRIDAAVHAGLAARHGDALGLTARGLRLARLFRLYRGILGTSKGG